MSARDPYIEYRLESIEFHNGAILGFRKARMWYNDDGEAIRIDNVDAGALEIDQVLREIADPKTGEIPDIKEVNYSILVHGYGRFGFYHPMQPGTGVKLLPPERGGSRLHFEQQQPGRKMFTKEWTLRDVTEGQIDSNKAVWQWHGYKHER